MVSGDWKIWLNERNIEVAMFVALALLLIVGVGWELLTGWVRRARKMQTIDAEMREMFQGESYRNFVRELEPTMAERRAHVGPSGNGDRNRDQR